MQISVWLNKDSLNAVLERKGKDESIQQFTSRYIRMKLVEDQVKIVPADPNATVLESIQGSTIIRGGK